MSGGYGANRMTVEQFKKLHRPKKTKFNNIRVDAPDGTFDSGWEEERYRQLELMEKAGVISNLRRQVSFPLLADGGEMIGCYVADATYTENGKPVAEDAKGCKSPVYRWKARHFKAQHGYAIRGVKKG